MTPDAHSHRSRDAVLPVLFAFALALGIIALFQTAPATGLYSLLVIPVGITARRLGLAAGLLAAIAAGTAIVVHAYAAEIDLSAAGYAVRATVLLAVAWFAAPQVVGEAEAVAVQRPPESPPRRLTPRELEVLRLLALGHTNAEIAEMLVLSVRTVESHRARLQRKLMRRGRSELTRYALQNGLIEASEAASSGHAPTTVAPPQALPGLATAAYTSSQSQPFRRT